MNNFVTPGPCIAREVTQFIKICKLIYPVFILILRFPDNIHIYSRVEMTLKNQVDDPGQ
jgi:hypothetical protein